jgi:hypothetical protein
MAGSMFVDDIAFRSYGVLFGNSQWAHFRANDGVNVGYRDGESAMVCYITFVKVQR